MIEIDKIYNEDCLQTMRNMPDKCVDLVVTDPPYEFKDTTGAGAFGTHRGKSASKKGRTYHADPTPMCGNKYLSDTEYIIFLRGKGAKVYGSYATKKKYWVQNTNTEDKNRFKHPTVKPLNIVETLIVNSTQEGGNFRPIYGQWYNGDSLHQGKEALHRL